MIGPLNRAASQIGFGGDIAQRALRAAVQATTSPTGQKVVQQATQQATNFVPRLLDVLLKLFRP